MTRTTHRIVLIIMLLLALVTSLSFAQIKEAPKQMTLTATQQAAVEFRTGLEAFWNFSAFDGRQHMRQALELDPSFALARAYLVRFDRKNVADLDRALADAARASAPEVLFVLGLRENLNGRSGRIAPMLELATKLAPDDPYLALEHAFVMSGNANIEAARAITKRFPDFAPGHAALGFWLGYSSTTPDDARLTEAWASAETALRLAPDAASANLAAVEVLYKTGKYDEAQKHVAKALAATPNSGWGLAMSAQIASAKGQHAEARRLMTRAIELEVWPGNFPMYERGLALAYMRDGDGREAVKRLEAAARKAQASGNMTLAAVEHMFCGTVLAGMGDKTALDHFAEGRRLHEGTWNNMSHNEVYAYALLGDPQRARVAMQDYIARRSATPPADLEQTVHSMTGMILLSEGKAKDAIAEFKQAEKNIWAMFGTAEAYRKLGMKKEMKAQRELMLGRPDPGLWLSAVWPIAMWRWRS